MAEYYLTYKEFSDYIDECISTSCGDRKLLEEHKSEILAAFLNEYETNSIERTESIQEMVELWQNQISQPSEMLLGKRYVAIQSGIMEFLKTFITSGIIEAIIKPIKAQTPFEVGITTSISIALAILEVFTKTKKLEDWDFCVFLQARTHYCSNEEFSKSDLLEWFPSDLNPICNMHNSIWKCSYYQDETNNCKINIERALNSLLQKDILKITSYRAAEELYRFVR